MTYRSRWTPPHPEPVLSECVWPKCPKFAKNDLPLCWAHLTVAHSLYVKHSEDPDSAKIGYTVVRDQEPAPAPRARPTNGTVYYLRSGGYVKIGWTSDLQKRMRAYPPDTVLLAVRPGTRADENATHRRFAHLVTHGREWFPLAPQISEHINQVLAEHGPPPEVEFAARKSAPATGQRQYVGGPNRGKLAARQVRG